MRYHTLLALVLLAIVCSLIRRPFLRADDTPHELPSQPSPEPLRVAYPAPLVSDRAQLLCASCKATRSPQGRVFLLPPAAPSYPYWDEDLVWHAHDPVKMTWTLQCSNGHQWGVAVKLVCPCDSQPDPSPWKPKSPTR